MPGIIKWLALLVAITIVAVGFRLYKKEQAAVLPPVSGSSAPQPSSTDPSTASPPLSQSFSPPETQPESRPASQPVSPEAVKVVSADPADYAPNVVASRDAPPICLRKLDGVATEVKASELLVTNCTKEEICYWVVLGRLKNSALAWCDKPLAAGASAAVSIAQVDRKITQAIEFKWWHKGKKIQGGDTYGPDHVRSEIVSLTTGP